MVPSWSNINYNNGIKERVLFSIIGILFISIFPFLYGVKTSYSAYYYNNPPLFIGLLCLLGIGFIRTGEYWVKAGYFLILTAIFDAYNYTNFLFLSASNLQLRFFLGGDNHINAIYQISYLEKDQVIIADVDKPTELVNDVGEEGYILIPDNLDKDIKNNLDFFLDKAGYGSSKGKAPERIPNNKE